MGRSTKSLDELVSELPSELREQVRRYVDSLVDRWARKRRRRLRQEWAGGLRKYRDQYTSLELQKKALEWRGD